MVSSVAFSESPAWPLFRGDRQATGVAASGLPDKLDLLWTFTIHGGGFESAAAIKDDVVYAGGGNGKLYAVVLSSGKQLWEFSGQVAFTAAPGSRSPTRISSATRAACSIALMLQTGKQLWKFECDGEIDSSANFDGDHLLVGSQDGSLYCLDRSSGTLVWKFEAQDQIRCFPTILGNHCFVAGCDENLHVIDLASGKSRADIPLQGPTGCAPAILNGIIYVGTENGEFVAVDPAAKKVLWRYRNTARSDAFRSSAAVTPDAIYVGGRDKILHAHDPHDGHKLWYFTARSRIDGSPVVVGERVFFGSGDGKFYSLDRKSGKELWQFTAGGTVIIAGRGRAVDWSSAAATGNLYCFGKK